MALQTERRKEERTALRSEGNVVMQFDARFADLQFQEITTLQ